MSILQEYQKHAELIGKKKYWALLVYLENNDVSYSDVVYNRKNWEEFDKWYRCVYNRKYEKNTGGNKKVQ